MCDTLWIWHRLKYCQCHEYLKRKRAGYKVSTKYNTTNKCCGFSSALKLHSWGLLLLLVVTQLTVILDKSYCTLTLWKVIWSVNCNPFGARYQKYVLMNGHYNLHVICIHAKCCKWHSVLLHSLLPQCIIIYKYLILIVILTVNF